MGRSKVLAFLASMPFGLGLFGLVALVAGLASFDPSIGRTVYASWWFLGIIALLVLNTGLCAWSRRAWIARGDLRRRFVWLLHFAVVMVAIGCGWAAATFSLETVAVRRGAEFAVGPETWSLQDVEVRRYPDGTVSDWISRVATPSGSREIKVNHPAVRGELKVLQSGYRQVYRVSLRLDGSEREVSVVQDVEAPLSADGRIGFALSPPGEGVMAKAVAEGAAPPFVDLLLTSQGRVLQQTSLFVGLPLELGETGLVLTVLEAEPESIFIIRGAPGLPLVWGGFGLFALSVTVVVMLPRRRAGVEEEPNA